MENRSSDSQIPLLKEIIALFLEGTKFFLGDSKRAQKAQQRLELKDPDDAAFFANCCQDLEKLGETLQGIPVTWSDAQGRGNKAIFDVLDVLQNEYLKIYTDQHESESDDSDDEGSQPHDKYTVLKKLYRNYTDPKHTPAEADKMSWFCEKTKLEKTRSSMRTKLIAALKACYEILKTVASPQPVDISWQPIDRTTMMYDTPLFKDAEAFHQALLDHWQCSCFDNRLHNNAMFSFETSPECGCANGMMYFQTMDEHACGWKSTRYQYRDYIDPPKPTKVEVKARSHSHGTLRRDYFCDVLEASYEGSLVKISADTSRLHVPPQDELSIPRTPPGTTFCERLPLSKCFELPPNHQILSMSPKRRMMLALFLAYAYMHLSGSAWWPYNRRDSVRLPDQLTSPDALPSAFFTASLLEDLEDCHQQEEFDFMICGLNADMPSLIPFAKLLLELYIGRTIVLSEIYQELTQCKDDFFGEIMIPVIKTCLKFDHPRTLNTPYTIRQDKNLRAHFQEKVVLRIQYILQTGFGVSPKDIFAIPAASQIAEVKTPKRLRSPNPVRVAGPQIVPAGFCLHDDGQPMSTLDRSLANAADEYLEKLKQCNSLVFNEQTGGGVKPVKIAILDTGADISDDALLLYEERIAGFRTWLETTAKEGKDLTDFHADDDGHGTHGTSVLLDATENTDVEVYVAQIFTGQAQKIMNDPIVDDPTIGRIANAITYAVNTWNVDIISMSFGFPQRIPEINKAIQHAHQKGVLMLAAASNCGGNDKRTWPAKDDRVLCVYAADGLGNKYPRNPTPTEHQSNFATLGSTVEALWPAGRSGKSIRVRKSGTSTATPICAAIAGLILAKLRRAEQGYVAASLTTSSDEKSLREEYQSKLDDLGRATGMAKVLRRMVDKRRDGYDYITPWTVFTRAHSESEILKIILEAID